MRVSSPLTFSHDSDHVTVHEVKGFATSDLTGAFVKAHAISKATQCRQFLFSLSLSPPPEEIVSTETFEKAIDDVEQKLDLSGQPRAIVFHEKNGRRHAHVVWSRIDAETMTAKQMSFYKMKLRDVSKDLFLEHSWKMPEGLADSQKRDPRNFTLQDWIQAKRGEQDPRDIKEALQDAWRVSDSLPAYQNALQERGYKLARGDRRGYVAVDYEGNVYAVARWTGLKTKDIRARLGSPKNLPSITEQKDAFATEIAPQIETHINDAKAIRDNDLAEIKLKQEMLVDQQKQERATLKEKQDKRAQAEQAHRQALYRKGIRGLVDRVTGRHARLKAINEQSLYLSLKRDQSERDNLIFQHIEARERLTLEKADVMENYQMVRNTLLAETAQSQQAREQEQELLRKLRRHSRNDGLGR